MLSVVCLEGVLLPFEICVTLVTAGMPASSAASDSFES